MEEAMCAKDGKIGHDQRGLLMGCTQQDCLIVKQPTDDTLSDAGDDTTADGNVLHGGLACGRGGGGGR